MFESSIKDVRKICGDKCFSFASLCYKELTDEVVRKKKKIFKNKKNHLEK